MVKRTRSNTSDRGGPLKRRKAMSKDLAKVMTDVSTSILPRSGIPRGVARRMYTKLRYYEQVTLNPPAGGVNVNIFRINSAYDPNFTGVGRQPKGLDQWFGLYDKGVITSAKIVVKAINGTAANTFIFGVSLRNDTGISATGIDYLEDPSSVHAAGSIYDLNQEVSLVYKPTWFGDSKKDSAQEDDELHFTAGADAGKVCYAHVFACGSSITDDPTAVNFQCFIEYNICFFEPNYLPLS